MKHPSFSLIIIPDTQFVTSSHPELLFKMTDWIASHAQELNLQYVLHLGDMVHHGAEREEEYRTAASAMNALKQAGIPLMICPGNHDYDNLLEQDRSLSMFNHYFGHSSEGNEERFGFYEPDKIENRYAKIECGERKLLILALEFGPRDAVMEWADSILRLYADREAIIITHSYLFVHGERTKAGDDHHPRQYIGSADANDGDEMWLKSFRRHRKLLAVFSGHHISGQPAYRIEPGDYGNQVLQSFQNWQKTEWGGEGRFRIMHFSENGGDIALTVYNPRTERLEEGVNHTILFRGNSQQPV